jgi:hypothetical protein
VKKDQKEKAHFPALLYNRRKMGLVAILRLVEKSGS